MNSEKNTCMYEVPDPVQLIKNDRPLDSERNKLQQTQHGELVGTKGVLVEAPLPGTRNPTW
jgi:hypothetical protein